MRQLLTSFTICKENASLYDWVQHCIILDKAFKEGKMGQTSVLFEVGIFVQLVLVTAVLAETSRTLDSRCCQCCPGIIGCVEQAALFR